MHSYVWRTALIACRDRDPVAVAHVGLFPGIATQSWVEDVGLWADADIPALKGLPRSFDVLLRDTLRDLRLDDKRLGVETGTELDTYLSINEFKTLQRRFPKAHVVSADSTIWAQRMVKSPWEHDVMREGARRACECVRTAFGAIRPGANERDIHRTYWRTAAELDLHEVSYVALRRPGYEWPHMISFIGHQQGLNHHEPPWLTAAETTELQPGMVLSTEIGAFDPDGEVFGSMPEDIILVTDGEPEIQTAHLSHDLWIA